MYARATRCTRGRFGVRADGSLYAGVCADGSVYARTCVDVCSLSEAVVGYVRVGGAASWACAHFSKVFRDCTGAVARTLWGLALAFLAFLHVPMRDGDALAHGVRRIGLPGTRSFVLRRVPLGWAGKPGAHFVCVRSVRHVYRGCGPHSVGLSIGVFWRFYTCRCPGPPSALDWLAGDSFFTCDDFERVTFEAGSIAPWTHSCRPLRPNDPACRGGE